MIPKGLTQSCCFCLQELETRLKKTHDEETLSQLKASQLSIEVVKSQAQLDAKEKMSEERVKFEKEKQIVENELLRRRKEEIAKVKNDFEAQLSALKMQVQRSDELRTKEVRCFSIYRKISFRQRSSLLRILSFQTDKHAAQVEELSNTIRQNQLQINEFSQQLSESKNQAIQLHREIEAKGQEILNVRREANNHIR